MPGRVHISEKTLAFLDDNYDVEDGKGIERAENDGGGSLQTYFISGRKNGLSHYKPWRKENEVIKTSDSNLQEVTPLRHDSLANVLEGMKNKHNGKFEKLTDPENVHIQGMNASEDDLEKAYLATENSISLSPTISPTKGKQKHIAKAPLPFPKLSATFNFTYGITLNEALMRDAMRASNDNQLVKLMQEKKIQKKYFFNPPLNIWNLNFTDVPPKEEARDIELTSPYQSSSDKLKEKQLSTESKYRDEGFKGFKLNPKVITFASPKVHFLFDVLTCAFTLIITLIAGLVLFNDELSNLKGFIAAVILCFIAAVVLVGFQLVKCWPSRFPKRISKCAGPSENSETGTHNILFLISFYCNYYY